MEKKQLSQVMNIALSLMIVLPVKKGKDNLKTNR